MACTTLNFGQVVRDYSCPRHRVLTDLWAREDGYLALMHGQTMTTTTGLPLAASVASIRGNAWGMGLLINDSDWRVCIRRVGVELAAHALS